MDTVSVTVTDMRDLELFRAPFFPFFECGWGSGDYLVTFSMPKYMHSPKLAVVTFKELEFYLSQNASSGFVADVNLIE